MTTGSCENFGVGDVLVNNFCKSVGCKVEVRLVGEVGQIGWFVNTDLSLRLII